jgi:hypothetical protein
MESPTSYVGGDILALKGIDGDVRMSVQRTSILTHTPLAFRRLRSYAGTRNDKPLEDFGQLRTLILSARKGRAFDIQIAL